MYIKVRTVLETKKESIVEKDKTTLVVSVKEKAERNEANKRVVELVAGHYRVPTKKVKIVSGHRRPNKLLEVGM